MSDDVELSGWELATTDFRSVLQMELAELQQRIFARHQQSLEQLDNAWRSAVSTGEGKSQPVSLATESRPGSKKHGFGNGQDLCLDVNDVGLPAGQLSHRSLQLQCEQPDVARKLRPDQLVIGLQNIVESCNQQNRGLETLAERLDRVTMRMGLHSMRLSAREQKDVRRGITESRNKTISMESWVDDSGIMSRTSGESYFTTSIASASGAFQEDFKPHPAWRKRPQLRTPVGVMNHRSQLQYHQRLLNRLDIAETDSHVGATPWVITPNSWYRLTWEILGMIFLSYDLVVVPLLVFQPQSEPAYRIADWTMLTFWTMDILMSFRLAYYTKNGILQTNSVAIAKNYCKRWFFFDFGVAAVDWIVMLGLADSAVLKSSKVVRALRFLRVFRLLRIVKITHFVNTMRLRITSQYAYVVTGIIEYLVMLILINHLIACSWFWIGNSGTSPNWVEHYGLSREDLTYKYIVSLHWSLTQFTPASMQVQPQNAWEQMFAVLVLVLALVIFGSLISSITVAMTALRSVNFMKADQFWMLRKYLRQHAISDDLSMHVTRYLTIAVSRQAARIQEDQVHILALLSAPLRLRLKNELFSNHLVVHPLFEKMCQSCISVINMLCCTAIQEDRLSREDVLFHCGEAAKKMYFIEEGKLAYLREKQEMQTCRRGEWCCEVILWCPWVHRGDMHARADCTVLALDSEQFREVVLSHPADAELPRRYCKAFCRQLKHMNDVSSRNIEPVWQLDDIQIGRMDLKNIVASISKDSLVTSVTEHELGFDEGAHDEEPVILDVLDVAKKEPDSAEKDPAPTTHGTTLSLDEVEDLERVISCEDGATSSNEATSSKAKTTKSARTLCEQGTLVSIKTFEESIRSGQLGEENASHAIRGQT